MNASSAYLWEQVDGKDFTVEEMARLLTEQYEVEETVALEDAKELANQWFKCGIIEI